MNAYPNLITTCKILLANLVTIAPGEVIFKIKTNKNFLRNAISQECPSSLVITSIEREIDK